MTHYSARDIVDLLRAALIDEFPSSPDQPTSIKPCANAAECFDHESKSKLRFWIPNPHEARSRMHEKDEDLRQVVFQIEDDDQSVLQVQCDGIVIDEQLGSLGLIQFCYATSLQDVILQYVREAMGLRHETLRRAGDGRAYYVELVLVIPMLEKNAIAKAGNVLRRLMSETGYLHALGVHVLTYSQASDEIGFRNSLSRAFSWLMPRSRSWFNDVARRRAQRTREIYAKLGRTTRLPMLSSLALKDFRLQGERRWKLDNRSATSAQPVDQISLHIIHGQNGTGKSTFVDAIELILTNQVDRLCQNSSAENPLIALRNRNLSESSNASLTIQLQSRDRKQSYKDSITLTLDANGKSELGDRQEIGTTHKADLSGFLSAYRENQLCRSAGCFRLEQNMADRLTEGNSGKRARVILESFFPDSDRQRVELDLYSKSWRSAVEELRNAWPDAKNIAWLSDIICINQDAEGTPRFWEVISNLFSEKLNWEKIGKLYCDDPEALKQELEVLVGGQRLASAIEGLETSSDMPKALATLGAAIDLGLSRTVLSTGHLEAVEHKLKEVFSWKAGHSGTYGSFFDYHQAVGRWLSKHVEFDLVQRVEQVSETVAQSDTSGSLIAQLTSIKNLTHPNKRGKLWVSSLSLKAERESLWNELINFQTDEEAARPATPKPRLSEADYSLIDQWVQTTPPLGQLIRSALLEDSRQSGVLEGSSFIIGTGELNAGRSVLHFIERTKTSLGKLKSLNVNRIPDLAQVYKVLQQFEQLRKERTELDNKSIVALQSNFQSNGKLMLALNELLSMFTPARWAYDEIGVTANLQGDSPNISFSTKSQEISQVLNTAELNILAMSLFFLCAPNTPNPLNMLILDDPLQNMDELTVTTVARGIDRLLRLWKTENFLASETNSEGELAPLKDISILLLLHGEDDTDRFRSETSCATYTLPWLMPLEIESKDDEKPTIKVTSSVSARLAKLNLVAER